MPADKKTSSDYQTLSSNAKKNGVRRQENDAREGSDLKPLGQKRTETFSSHELQPRNKQTQIPSESLSVVETESVRTEFVDLKSDFAAANQNNSAAENNTTTADLNADSTSDLTYAELQKRAKQQKKAAKTRELLTGDRWLERNGHTLSYVGLYAFSIMVLFRPYELVPGLGFLSTVTFYIALATLLVYIPTQFSTEGNLTVLSTEVKAILALTAIAIITIPIAKSPGTAWENFNEPFIKAVLIFIVMVNVLRTRARLMGMIWLSLLIGVVLSYLAIGMYARGEANIEGYRISIEIGGMFENPNEMSLHLVMMIPLAITLALASRKALMKIVYLVMAIFMLSANMVTFSRGGFLGLLGAAAVLVWKLGRRNRVTVTSAALFAGTLLVAFAPGNYGLRILSIFIPGLDPVGSSSQRSELLERSIIVSLRNPWGIGIGNFPIVGVRNLVSHNAFTQVSAELGILGLIAYLVFIISPFRKLSAIEQTEFAKNETNWFYYLSIGLQASIVAYLIGSFFASVAYNWFIYYLIAYAVAFRRIYQIEHNLHEELKPKPLVENFWSTRPAGVNFND